ncbi:MAG: maltose alpha-D-glucosyltransferase [Thermaerobacter sp.]|nr:maltose alpha-D-glucosyltransferase [Thermaerobacter sp.]
MPNGVDDWYRDAIIYELHVRTFYDGNGDGIGDFQGLRQKLPYLKDLGVTALWLLPFYPSPGRDDGYDIADYQNVHPNYGTLAEFRAFLNDAHRLGLRVITELVINHTSDQHPWFERARHAKPGSAWRNFYVWSDTADRYTDARIIFPDFERSNWTWDPVAGQYYWHRFYSHQPDLNFDSLQVRRAVLRTVDFWLGMGVDGLRLDAVPYLFEREGTSCENLPETHAYLKDLRRHVDEHFPHRMLLAEANQWPEDAVAYFGDGDECHMAFHFPLMPRLFMGLYQESPEPILDILEETPPVPEGAQWALFLRNHDELTLEMVTEQERDYMYQAYAEDPRSRINLGIRRRLMPLLNNNRRRAELMHALLLALPGTPVLYYGNEIGMGDNIYLGDRDGVRTPFQWSGDKNAGFSRANPQKLVLPVVTDPEYHYEAVNAEAQRANPHSLWWWLKRLIALRRSTPAFGRGQLSVVDANNPHVLAFVRSLPDSDPPEHVLVVANLSRFAQLAALDLSAYQGTHLVELFGRTAFPAVAAEPYPITLGPHGFFYFRLDPVAVEVGGVMPLGAPLMVRQAWEELLDEGAGRRALEAALLRHLGQARWFGGRGRHVARCQLESQPPLAAFRLLTVRVTYQDGGQERYLVPAGWSDDPSGHDLVEVRTDAGQSGFVRDAGQDPEFSRAVAARLARRNSRGRASLAGWTQGAFLRRWNDPDCDWTPHPLTREQSNTSVRLGNTALLKLYRRLEPGPQPDFEVTRYLNRMGFAHSPTVLATLDLLDRAPNGRDGTPATTLLSVASYVPHTADGWEWAAAAAQAYVDQPSPDALAALMPDVARLARVTAELHRALLSPSTDPAFKPEPMTPFIRRSLYQGVRQDLTDTIRRLTRAAAAPGPMDLWTLGLVRRTLEARARLAALADAVLDAPLTVNRCRIHGDLHLGQVLYTGDDFVVIDFEGEPRRRLSERRLKSLPVRDVAGMLRSWHYAALSAVGAADAAMAPSDRRRRAARARTWHRAVADHYLDIYRDALPTASCVPKDASTDPWLGAFLLEKAAYEVQYELGHRPEWAWIPLLGLLALAGVPEDDAAEEEMP